MPDARVGNPVRSRAPELPRDRLRCGVAVGIERRNRLPRLRSEIMQVCIDRHDDLPELRGPARRLPRSRHAAGTIVDRLGECGFEAVPNIAHDEGTSGQSACTADDDGAEERTEGGEAVAAAAPKDGKEREVPKRRLKTRMEPH